MRIAFDMRALERPELAQRGIGRYVSSLHAALQERGAALVTLRGGQLRRPPLPERIADLAEHVLLGRDARRSGASVLHSPSIDFATIRPQLPYVVTVHDLVPLKHPRRYLRTGAKHRLRYEAVKRATRVIVPTRAVASDCKRLLGIDRIDVVAEAPATVFRPVEQPGPLLARFDLPDEFLLWVGGLDPPDPRKGITELAAAAGRHAGLPLVLAGRIDARAAELAKPGRVILLGRPTDEELAALYSAATALVLPSQDEGFGLPAIEALACGTPVTAFAIDAMREQYAGSADVALVDRGDHAALLTAAAAFGGRRASAPTRTWSDVADETWAVYELAARSS